MKVVINRCFGGFGLSERAYERLIELGVPVRAYIEQKQNPETRLYEPESWNDGEVIFDRALTPEQDFSDEAHRRWFGRYWDSWLCDQRTHPLLIQVVEELRVTASGNNANLAVVEIPDGIDYTIEDYDGSEHIAEVHNTWG